MPSSRLATPASARAERNLPDLIHGNRIGMSDLVAARKRFLERPETLRNLRRDFREWHLGRPRYAIWAIDVDRPEIRRQVAAAERHLADLLLDGYRRQPHVTLATCGFPNAAPERADDFGADALAAQLRALGEMRRLPFDLEIGILASFSSAPFLHADDPGQALPALRACLAPRAASDEHAHDYLPHVTVGLYAGAWPSAAVGRRLDAFAGAERARCRIERISLMTYAAAEIGGVLTTVADYHLAEGRIEWREVSPFAALNGD